MDAFRAVDLGLSVKWASCNIGSSKPEEYGDYYAWGETEPKQLSYKWFDGDQYHIIKYNYLSSFGPIDNKMVLEPEDDVATITLGEGWRIPTYEEGKELIENCTKEYYVMNGVKGYLFTSRVPGYTEQSIFLPYAGSFNGIDYELVGISAFYWSSTLCTGPTSACWPNHAFTIFDAYLSGRQQDHLEYLRSLGHSIRPVFDK